MNTQVNDSAVLASRLSENVTGTADHVLVGLNWTVVVGPLGLKLIAVLFD